MRYFCRECHVFTERDQEKCCENCEASLIDAPIAPGTEIGGFELLAEIGRGANGIVYLARQLTLERDVALKVLPEEKAEDPQFVKNFLKEARAAAKLNHPNIVQAYDAGVSGQGVYFFAMEYIPPGGVYGWAAPSGERQFYAYPLFYIASLIDIGSWSEVYNAIVVKPNSLSVRASFDPGLKQWYPYFLYSTGWAAWRLDCTGALKMTLDKLHNELKKSKEYAEEAYAMAADLALKLHMPLRAVRILDLYKKGKPNRNILLPLFYLKASIANSEVNEKQVLNYIEDFIRGHGNNRFLQNDIELLDIFRKMLRGEKIKEGTLTSKLFEMSSFP